MLNAQAEPNLPRSKFMFSKIKTCDERPVNQRPTICKQEKELGEGRTQWGENISPLFRTHFMFYPHSKRRKRGHPSCFGLTTCPGLTPIFQGVIPAASPTFSLFQVPRRHSSFLGEETPLDSTGREAQTPSPTLSLAFLPA